MAPLMLPIELISHLSRVLSLTLRLFGNIFAEHLVVLIIASIVPFIVPLPIQMLGLIVGPLQAFIFMTLTAIYLSAATRSTNTTKARARNRSQRCAAVKGRSDHVGDAELRDSEKPDGVERFCMSRPASSDSGVSRSG